MILEKPEVSHTQNLREDTWWNLRSTLQPGFCGKVRFSWHATMLGGANRNPKFPTPKICVKILSETREVPYSKYFTGRYLIAMECDMMGGKSKFKVPHAQNLRE